MTEHRSPAKRRSMAKRYHPVWLFAAWTLFIFLHSLQPAELSGQESGWVLSLLLGLFPWLTDHILRKAAHLTEFAVQGFLSEPLGHGLLDPGASDRPPASLPRWAAVWFSLSLCGLTALCDETIQLFVEGRSGQVSDVWLDIAGAAAGIAASVLIQAVWRRVRESGQRSSP